MLHVLKNHVVGTLKAGPRTPAIEVNKLAPLSTRTSSLQPKTSTFHLLTSIQAKPYPLRSRNFELHNRILQDVWSFELVAENEKGRASRAVRFRGLLGVWDIRRSRISSTDRLTFCSYEGQKKTEIEVGLDEYLTKNAAQYSNDPRLAQFFKTRRGESSPVKKESAISDTETKTKQVKRRVTKAAEEFLPTSVQRASNARQPLRS